MYHRVGGFGPLEPARPLRFLGGWAGPGRMFFLGGLVRAWGFSSVARRWKRSTAFTPLGKWRADLAHHSSQTLIEIEGGKQKQMTVAMQEI